MYAISLSQSGIGSIIAEAILPDTEEKAKNWVEFNKEMSEIWPNITEKKEALPNAKEKHDIKNKFEKYFNKNPGK